MTIEKTREILGNDVEELSDAEIIYLIQSTSSVVDSIFDLYIKKNLTRKSKGVQNG